MIVKTVELIQINETLAIINYCFGQLDLGANNFGAPTQVEVKPFARNQIVYY